MATTSGTLNSLYPALIIALANSAPHFKDLTVIASTRLIQLFKSFSNPLFLLADEGHPRLLFFMYVRCIISWAPNSLKNRLELFNSIILNHLSNNPNVIYGILTAHKIFEDLGTFTLSRGLREIKRVQMAKEEQARKVEGNPKGKGTDSGDEADPGAEKARLLESETGVAPHNTDSVENLAGSPRTSEERRRRESEVVTQSFMSPSSESPGGSFTMAASEKARGKMKERRSLSLDTNNSLDRVAAAGVGRNGFVPTQEWVSNLLVVRVCDLRAKFLNPRLLRGNKGKNVTCGASE